MQKNERKPIRNSLVCMILVKGPENGCTSALTVGSAQCVMCSYAYVVNIIHLSIKHHILYIWLVWFWNVDVLLRCWLKWFSYSVLLFSVSFRSSIMNSSWSWSCDLKEFEKRKKKKQIGIHKLSESCFNFFFSSNFFSYFCVCVENIYGRFNISFTEYYTALICFSWT